LLNTLAYYNSSAVAVEVGLVCSTSHYQLVKRSAGFAEPELVEFVAGVAVAVAAQADVLQVVGAVAEHLPSQVRHVAVNWSKSDSSGMQVQIWIRILIIQYGFTLG
jgi:hypothetical protein